MSIEKVLLEILLGGGGAGAVVFYLWQKLEKMFVWAAALDLTAKRAVIGVLCFVLVQAFYWLAVAIALLPMPADGPAWFGETFQFASLAFMGGTYFHGFLDRKGNPTTQFHADELPLK